MERCPFDDKAACSWRKLSFDECQRFYIDDCFTARVDRMKVRRWMIAKIHLNDDTVESTEFRHVSGGGLALGKLLQGFYLSVACRAHRGKGRFLRAILDVHLQLI